MDPSAYISVGAAVRFQRENSWSAVRAACHALATQTRDRINEITGLASVCPESPDWLRFSRIAPTLLYAQSWCDAFALLASGAWDDANNQKSLVWF